MRVVTALKLFRMTYGIGEVYRVKKKVGSSHSVVACHQEHERKACPEQALRRTMPGGANAHFRQPPPFFGTCFPCPRANTGGNTNMLRQFICVRTYLGNSPLSGLTRDIIQVDIGCCVH
jgi:hypothetical protein